MSCCTLVPDSSTGDRQVSQDKGFPLPPDVEKKKEKKKGDTLDFATFSGHRIPFLKKKADGNGHGVES